MPLPVATIGDWTTTQLVKFIKDILENQPTRNVQTLIVGNAQVNETLALKGQVTFPDNQDVNLVGGAGKAPFTNAWVNWGSPNFPAGYWKDPFGFVHLQGVIKSGVVGDAAFVLPPGFWPAYTAGPFAVLSNGGVGRVDVGADGAVTPMSPSSNVYVSLDGITFKAA